MCNPATRSQGDLDVRFDGLLSVPGSAFLLLAAAVALAVTLKLVPQREGPGRRDLIGFLWATVWWSACSMIENLPLPADYRLVFGNLAWFGINLAPLLACFLLWTCTFGRRRPVPGWLAARERGCGQCGRVPRCVRQSCTIDVSADRRLGGQQWAAALHSRPVLLPDRQPDLPHRAADDGDYRLGAA
jgi:hypothetical protein